MAFQFTQQFVGTNWTASNVPGSPIVTLTSTAPGTNPADVTPAAFTGTYFGATNGNGSVTAVTTTQGGAAGSLGSQSTFTVAFDTTQTAALAAGTFVFDGATVTYAAGDGSISLATKITATLFANFTVDNNDNGSVTFTAKVTGPTPIGTDADFDVDAGSLGDGIIGTVLGAAGTAPTNTTTTVIPAGPGPGLDKIDFTFYSPKAVFVDGVLLKGVAPAIGQTYIDMKNSTTNPGEYTITQFTENGATDTNVGLIGVADFGQKMAFVADNFVLAYA